MTDPGYRHLIIIVDRSGSMANIREWTQSGFREFVAKQRLEPVRTTVSLYSFDDDLEKVTSFSTLDDVADWLLVPRGMTNLYDAVVEVITIEGKVLAEMFEDQRPGSVALLIVTDGLQTLPSENTVDDMKHVVTHQQEVYNWGVLYLGTNQDAINVGQKYGMTTNSSLSYAPTDKSVNTAWKVSSAVLSRASESVTVAAAAGQSANAYDIYTFNLEEREQVMADDHDDDDKEEENT
jgi:hypothetical protein